MIHREHHPHNHLSDRIAPMLDFSDQRAAELEGAVEKASSTIGILIHPFYIDNRDYPMHKVEGWEAYQNNRARTLARVMNSNFPTIVFEEERAVRDPDLLAKYRGLDQNPNLIILPTISNNPTPVERRTKMLDHVYRVLYLEGGGVTTWSEYDWEQFNAMLLAADLAEHRIHPRSGAQQPPELISGLFKMAAPRIDAAVWNTIADRLKSIGADTIVLGGSQYHELSNSQNEIGSGCVGLTAHFLSERGFSIRLMRTMTFPTRPSLGVRQVLRARP